MVPSASERKRCIQKGFGELLLVETGDEVYGRVLLAASSTTYKEVVDRQRRQHLTASTSTPSPVFPWLSCPTQKLPYSSVPPQYHTSFLRTRVNLLSFHHIQRIPPNLTIAFSENEVYDRHSPFANHCDCPRRACREPKLHRCSQGTR